ncbi:hypothetical protein ACIBW9_36795 [Streptomyces sp. NPDC049541]|uniref:hypothetical protein n=1 Tax=Streptomyces sp. NPDC049541 TaxID=3365594 RepID=UPI0037A5C092
MRHDWIHGQALCQQHERALLNSVSKRFRNGIPRQQPDTSGSQLSLQRAVTRGVRWRQVFLTIYDNALIVTAVDDPGITAPARQQWIEAELN